MLPEKKTLPVAWHLIDIPIFKDHRGGLCFLESGRDLPFKFERFYYLFESDPAYKRGGHAHINLHQCYIALHGTINIRLHNGEIKETIELSSPAQGLVINPITWRDIQLEKNAVLAVLASDYFDESDYIRDFEQFQNYVKTK